MNQIQVKIEQACSSVFLFCLSFTIIWMVRFGIGIWMIAQAISLSAAIDVQGVKEGIGYATQSLLLAVVFLYTAFIFKKIGNSATPFMKGIPHRFKIVAILLFIAVALPSWIVDIYTSVATGNVGFTVFGEPQIMAAGVSFLIYCIALVFQYGCQLQDESYEIL